MNVDRQYVRDPRHGRDLIREALASDDVPAEVASAFETIATYAVRRDPGFTGYDEVTRTVELADGRRFGVLARDLFAFRLTFEPREGHEPLNINGVEYHGHAEMVGANGPNSWQVASYEDEKWRRQWHVRRPDSWELDPLTDSARKKAPEILAEIAAEVAATPGFEELRRTARDRDLRDRAHRAAGDVATALVEAAEHTATLAAVPQGRPPQAPYADA